MKIFFKFSLLRNIFSFCHNHRTLEEFLRKMILLQYFSSLFLATHHTRSCWAREEKKVEIAKEKMKNKLEK